MQEPDFESAINSLETSTAAIEKQTTILEAQKDALKKLQNLNREPTSTITDNDEKRSMQTRTKAQLDLETIELTESIQQRVTVTQRHADSSLNMLKTSSRRQLDNRLLDGLQKVMFKLTPRESSEKRLPDFSSLSHALVKLESKIIKDRTNTTYLEVLDGLANEKDSSGHQNSAQVTEEAYALTEELESLILEVDSVLDMTISRRYRAPIVNALKLSDAQAQLEQHSWLEYVCTTSAP
jgi:hypothetical protein